MNFILALLFSAIFELMGTKVSFKNDYSEGAHPRILEVLLETNLQQEAGYGYDRISEQAKTFIRKHLENPDTPIYFVSGGTQANLLVISHLLKPYESVIAADTGHIHVHETGAIEYAGHKINTVPHIDGKLTIEGIQSILDLHNDEHMVKPALVYISQTTELGSIYTKEELQLISTLCREKGLKLFIDGARMAAALCSEKVSLGIRDVAAYADVFYLGATKNGGLLGEAIIFANSALAEGFSYAMKQKGALMAKGRLLAAQFYALFEHQLYFDLAKRANRHAMRIAEALQSAGFSFSLSPESNQLFPILPYSVINVLYDEFEFYVWEKLNEKEAVVRIVCSWATNENDVDLFIKRIKDLSR